MAFGNVSGMGSWGVALAASLALHVVVLGAMLGTRGCGGTSTPPPPPIPQTDGRANDLPSPNDAEPSPEKPAEQSPTVPKVKADSSTRHEKAKSQDARKVVGKSDRSKAESKKSPVEKDESPDVDSAKDGWKSYKVKAGDSLTKIARSCGLTVPELAKANGISPTANLMLGQTLKIKNSSSDKE